SDSARSDSARSDATARSGGVQPQAERTSTTTDRSWPQEPPPDYGDDEDGRPPSASRPVPTGSRLSRTSAEASTPSKGNSVPRPGIDDDPREQTDPDQPGT